ncbi:MAG: hypothetical protein AAF206_30185 [Bacteroidota bacterium]
MQELCTGIAKRLTQIATLWFLVFCPLFSHSQGISARWVADTNAGLIGDHIRVELSIEHHQSLQPEWPVFQDTIGGLEILEASALDTLSNAANLTRISQNLVLTPFDSGSYRLPVVDVFYDNNGQRRSTFTNTIPIEILTVPVDTTQGLKPIKGIQIVGWAFEDFVPWILGTLGVGLLAFLLYWFVLRKKQTETPLGYAVPDIPAHEIAMRQLGKLEEKRHWQNGEVKEYYVGLSMIIREYLERKFDLMALESITDDILRDLDEKYQNLRQQENLRHLLEVADLAKFAKYQPTTDENLQAIEKAREFIKETKTWQAVMPEVPQVEPETDVEEA